MMRDDLASLVDDLRRQDGPWEEHGPGPTDWPTWETGAELYAALTPERVSTLDRETTLLLLSGLAREEEHRAGAWVSMFESGRGTWLFERWLELSR